MSRRRIPASPFLLSSLASCGLMSTGLLAQSVDKGAKDYSVQLSVEGDWARVTDPLDVALSVSVINGTKLPTNLFSGGAIEYAIDGKAHGSIEKATSKGKGIAFAKGSSVRITLPLATAELFKRARQSCKQGEVKTLTLSVGGDADAMATVKIAGDDESVPLEALDHSKARVALVTNFGTMLVKFRPDKAPKTVANFLKLSRSRFYDGTRFHRVIRNFMAQGGDPNTRNADPLDDGTGGPGWSIQAEFNDIKHVRGVLSMARGQDVDSAGSQFFIVHGTASSLDGKYTGFGKLAEGLDCLDRICDVPVVPRPGSREESLPTQDIKLLRAVMIAPSK